jgi:hypothetical protein
MTQGQTGKQMSNMQSVTLANAKDCGNKPSLPAEED